VGLETAEPLLNNRHEVIVVEAAPRIGADLGLTVRPVLMNRLINSEINVFNNAVVKKISGGSVTLERTGDEIVLREVDTVLVSVGSEPHNPLGDNLNIPVYNIGDCSGTQGIMEAIAAGAKAGSGI
jgi:pyruvate/2-oxoglutarate dehydrogenase complex dihydrolipoamide dehydrogenase (E3) component